MKLLKNKKIILLISGFGILTTSIIASIIIINKNKNKELIKNQNQIKEIISKIKDKDILIPANVSTQNQSEIQNAIKNHLKKENQTLNDDDLSKITINNIESLALGEKIEINLIIKVRNTTKKLTINLEKINLLKSSNIDDGWDGTIFQDKFKNLWTMGYKTPLQVLKANDSKDGYVSGGWNSVTSKGLLNRSNIDDGYDGTIFQDSFGNLWAMGRNTKLQVLKANDSKDGYASSWVDDKDIAGLTNGSNITDGNSGTIFQDSFGNLWAMGLGTPLQVLKANDSKDGYVKSWTDDNNIQGLLNDSKIVDGVIATIFQDSFENLWVMGSNTKLQVLKANDSKDGYEKSWTNNNNQGLLNSSNIINGPPGTIFQDSFGNLWAMGNGTKLQVLKVNNSKSGYVNEGWTDVITKGLLKGSNISNGLAGTIFQDFFGNLWAMGKNKLQVLKVNNSKSGYIESWTDVNNIQGLLNGSNIDDGNGGAIFQDSFGNLWAMGFGTPLQVLKVNSNGTSYLNEGWSNVNNTQGLLNGSNIVDGNGGTIFQDSFGNLWAMSKIKKLQVLIANSNNTGYINSWLY